MEPLQSYIFLSIPNLETRRVKDFTDRERIANKIGEKEFDGPIN